MISIVVPCYNEEEALDHLYARLRPTLDKRGEPYEVVFVDDGSSDRTIARLRELKVQWPAVRICELVRNSGHQAAISAGIASAVGDYVITIDADLQDPPELINEMVDLAESEGLDVVYARRSSRAHDTIFKRVTARLYYWLIRLATGVDLVPNVGDYRLITRRVAITLSNLPEQRRVYRLLVPWLGYPSGVVEHVREERAAGESKYGLRKMVSLAVDSMASFSNRPLHLATALGTVTSIGSIIAAIAVIGTHFTLGQQVPGWASLTTAIFFLSSVQLLCLGVLGSYVGRIYDEVRHRPLYQIRDLDPATRGDSTDA